MWHIILLFATCTLKVDVASGYVSVLLQSATSNFSVQRPHRSNYYRACRLATLYLVWSLRLPAVIGICCFFAVWLPRGLSLRERGHACVKPDVHPPRPTPMKLLWRESCSLLKEIQICKRLRARSTLYSADSPLSLYWKRTCSTYLKHSPQFINYPFKSLSFWKMAAWWHFLRVGLCVDAVL